MWLSSTEIAKSMRAAGTFFLKARTTFAITAMGRQGWVWVDDRSRWCVVISWSSHEFFSIYLYFNATLYFFLSINYPHGFYLFHPQNLIWVLTRARIFFRGLMVKKPLYQRICLPSKKSLHVNELRCCWEGIGLASSKIMQIQTQRHS